MSEPKIILFDLETIPDWDEAFKVWPQISDYPGRTLKATIGSIICCGYKVFGDAKPQCINAWDFSRWDRNVNDDYSVCREISKVLNEADAVVTHNGIRFDWRYLQTRLVKNKLPKLDKIHHIDTCQLARKHMYAFNNRLDTLAQLVGGIRKQKHEGWELWRKVYYKDEEAMETMTSYCMQDVEALESIFKELRPFATNIPNHNLFNNSGIKCCPNCGAYETIRQGHRITKTIKYQRYSCKKCGTWFRTDARDLKPRSY